MVVKMRDWHNLFLHAIFERGVEYYSNNRVLEYSFESNIIQASVQGEFIYDVHIVNDNNQIIDAYCDCPHAQKGNLCTHMVAELLEYDSNE